MKKLVLGIIFLASFASRGYSADRVSLGELRHRWVGVQIVMVPNGETYVWSQTKEKKGQYSYTMFGNSSESMAGNHAIIVAVNPYGTPSGGNGSDSDNVLVDLFYVTVRLDDGKLVSCTTSQPGLDVAPPFVEMSVMEKRRQMATTLGETLRGKSIYLTARHGVYDDGLTMPLAVKSIHGERFNEASMTSYPKLVPIAVEKVLYDAKLDVTVIQLRLPNGRLARVVASRDIATGNLDLPFLTEIPAKFTSREIDAIRSGSFFVGMSEDALWDALGMPDKINDYGTSEQWVYPGGTFIYLDASKHVIDRQNIN